MKKGGKLEILFCQRKSESRYIENASDKAPSYLTQIPITCILPRGDVQLLIERN